MATEPRPDGSIEYEPGLTPATVRGKVPGPPFFLGLEFDRSTWALIAANVFAVAVALATSMGFADMLVVFWIQSMIIGACAVIRIMSLKQFSQENFGTTWGPVEHNLAGKAKLAGFFVLVYGVMHAMYLVFLLFGAGRFGGLHGSLLGYGLCAAAFAINHGYSLWVNLRRDIEGRPNIGNITMLPFARIVPIHISTLIGGAAASGALGMIMFLFFKMIIDVIMHSVEHKALRARKPCDVYVS